MKPKTLRRVLIAAVILLPLLFNIPPLFRYGLPAAVILVLMIVRRGSLWYLLGLKAASRRDAGQALKYMLKAARAGLPVKQGCVAAVTLIKGDCIAEAEELFTALGSKKLYDSEPSLLESYRALLVWQKGDRQQAREILESLLSAGYRTTHLYSTLGYFMLHSGSDPQHTIDFNLEAVDYDATPDILDNLTAAYIAVGAWDEARETADRVTAAKPAFSEAWYHAGIIAEEHGDLEQAESFYEKTLRSVFSPLTVLTREVVEARLSSVQEMLPGTEETEEAQLPEELPVEAPQANNLPMEKEKKLPE
jgi:tetratricopeptide (TPR) repeat protein